MGGLQQYLEDGVRPTALGIHGGISDNPILFAPGHELQTIQMVGDAVLG